MDKKFYPSKNFFLAKNFLKLENGNSRSALFYMKTKYYLKYFVRDCSVAQSFF